MTYDSALDAKEQIKAEIERGLADLAEGRVQEFDAQRIIDRGRVLLAKRSHSI